MASEVRCTYILGMKRVRYVMYDISVYRDYRYTQRQQVPSLRVLICSPPPSPYSQVNNLATSPEPAGTRVLSRLHVYVYMQCNAVRRSQGLDST
jgi:hypothetical protein